MLPGFRSLERFFHALAQVVPASQLSHVHLVHHHPHFPSPLPDLMAQGFCGTVVAARASIAQGLAVGSHLVLHDHPTATEAAQDVLMELPQGREAARLAIYQSLQAIHPPGRLWVYGPKESGIQSLGKGNPLVQVALIKGHMRLLSMTKGCGLDLEDGILDQFSLLQHHDLTIASLPAIFSWKTLDPASLLLLEALLPEDPGEKLLDWGCGSGWLGCAMAKRWPHTKAILSDDLWAAVRAARETVSRNGLSDRVEVVAEDGVGQRLSKERFSTILSNPPFHRGLRTDREIALEFINQARTILQPSGRLWVVGNRFLDYGPVLEKAGFRVTVVRDHNEFTVWRGINPKPSRVSPPKNQM